MTQFAPIFTAYLILQDSYDVEDYLTPFYSERTFDNFMFVRKILDM